MIFLHNGASRRRRLNNETFGFFTSDGYAVINKNHSIIKYKAGVMYTSSNDEGMSSNFSKNCVELPGIVSNRYLRLFFNL